MRGDPIAMPLHRRVVPFVALVVTFFVDAGGGLRAQEATAVAPPSPPPTAWQVPIEGRPHAAFEYRWNPNWPAAGKAGLGSTHGCLVVTRDGNVLANTDTDAAVLVFAPSGALVRKWGEEFHGGLHGMLLRQEGDAEFLYLAHTRRHEVVKTTIDGKVLWTIGWPAASGVYETEDQFVPTSVAVARDGRIFVADGYGKSFVHVFDAERRYVKSFGGPGSEPGKMQTPHGLWLDERGEEPRLLVCDRENHRLQWFTLDGAFVRLVDKDLRRPCNVWPFEKGLLVADLGGRITVLDSKDQVVVHLGDNPDEAQRASNGVPKEKWRDGVFLAPHSVCVDRDHTIYVMDWNSTGRVSRIDRVGEVQIAPRSK